MSASHLSLKRMFVIASVLFVATLFAAGLDAWTGPTATAPSGNVAAPINVGTTDQVKDAGISMNALAVFGSGYIADALGIGRENPIVPLDVNGTIRIANSEETCQAVTEGAQRYNSTTKVMEFCDGTSWGSIGDSSPLKVIGYANFSHTGGAVTLHAGYNLTVTPTSPTGRYTATLTEAADDMNYLTFFSSEYSGGAATDMYKLSVDSTSQFTFQCDHSPYYGNRVCGSHASILVLAAQ